MKVIGVYYSLGLGIAFLILLDDISDLKRLNLNILHLRKTVFKIGVETNGKIDKARTELGSLDRL